MKHDNTLGSRIAEVHNGSSLFTGDAGQGESNTRRWIIENDWLEAIVALPLNMFYNTGIATYIWVLSNRKAEHRQGQVQLIDATQWFRPLRKNQGKKNCELSQEDIERITDTFLKFEESEQSKIFPNAAFGYWKVVVDRPLRLAVDLSSKCRKKFRAVCVDCKEEAMADLVDRVTKSIGEGPHLNFNSFMDAVEKDAKDNNVNLIAKRKKLLHTELSVRDEKADPIVKKVHKKGKAKADPIRGLFPNPDGDKAVVLEYEPNLELRDTEQIPLLEDGGIEAFIRREVLTHAEAAWFDEVSVKIGYEISFNRYFYKPEPLRSLESIRGDILALEKETEGLLAEIVGGGS